MLKKLTTAAILGFASLSASVERADAQVFYGVAPVRRVVARAVLPPYPIAQRVVSAPVYGPAYGPVYGAPVYYGYGGPVYSGPVYGAGVSVPGVSVRLGW